MDKRNAASWVLQIVVAAIVGQMLFFKFTGAPEAKELFAALGAEPWGRIGTGFLELAAVVLILVPRLAVLGALLALGLMIGAIGAHLAIVGIEIAGDGGLLFALAWVTLLAAAGVVWLRRGELLRLAKRGAGAAE